MNIFIEITVFIVIFWLLVGIFRMIAHKVEQFIELCEKINSTREIGEQNPAARRTTKINKEAAKVLAHRNR